MSNVVVTMIIPPPPFLGMVTIRIVWHNNYSISHFELVNTDDLLTFSGAIFLRAVCPRAISMGVYLSGLPGALLLGICIDGCHSDGAIKTIDRVVVPGLF